MALIGRRAHLCTRTYRGFPRELRFEACSALHGTDICLGREDISRLPLRPASATGRKLSLRARVSTINPCRYVKGRAPFQPSSKVSLIPQTGPRAAWNVNQRLYIPIVYHRPTILYTKFAKGKKKDVLVKNPLTGRLGTASRISYAPSQATATAAPMSELFLASESSTLDPSPTRSSMYDWHISR